MVEYRSIAEIRCKSRDEHAGPDLLLIQEGGMTQELCTHRHVVGVLRTASIQPCELRWWTGDASIC